jgi:hypothetical protein
MPRIVSVCGTFENLMRQNARIFSSESCAARMRHPQRPLEIYGNLSLVVASEMFVHPLVSTSLDATVLRVLLV